MSHALDVSTAARARAAQRLARPQLLTRRPLSSLAKRFRRSENTDISTMADARRTDDLLGGPPSRRTGRLRARDAPTRTHTRAHTRAPRPVVALPVNSQLSIAAREGQKDILFAAVFVVVWAGGALVTLNAQLLGGTMCVAEGGGWSAHRTAGSVPFGFRSSIRRRAPPPSTRDHHRPTPPRRRAAARLGRACRDVRRRSCAARVARTSLRPATPAAAAVARRALVAFFGRCCLTSAFALDARGGGPAAAALRPPLRSSFFQSVCILGYCVFPLNIACLACLVLQARLRPSSRGFRPSSRRFRSPSSLGSVGFAAGERSSLGVFLSWLVRGRIVSSGCVAPPRPCARHAVRVSSRPRAADARARARVDKVISPFRLADRARSRRGRRSGRQAAASESEHSCPPATRLASCAPCVRRRLPPRAPRVVAVPLVRRAPRRPPVYGRVGTPADLHPEPHRALDRRRRRLCLVDARIRRLHVGDHPRAAQGGASLSSLVRARARLCDDGGAACQQEPSPPPLRDPPVQLRASLVACGQQRLATTARRM